MEPGLSKTEKSLRCSLSTSSLQRHGGMGVGMGVQCLQRGATFGVVPEDGHFVDGPRRFDRRNSGELLDRATAYR